MHHRIIIYKMAESDKRFKHCFFDGTTDVEKFVVRIDLEASLKNYQDEKKAQYLASKLIGPAMEVYLRLSAEDKKEFDKIKDELYTEFLKGQLDREEAVTVLGSRTRVPGEAAHTFAHKVIELVKLAYPTFGNAVRLSIILREVCRRKCRLLSSRPRVTKTWTLKLVRMKLCD